MISTKKTSPLPVPHEFSAIPYAGLFGDTVMARVVEEIIADPHSVYHLKDLEELTGNSAPRIREALATLTTLGLLKSSGGKHPAYTVDISRKSFIALTLLAYAVLDDREGSDCMETAIRHYCDTRMLPGSGEKAGTLATDFPLTEDIHRIVRAHGEVRWGEIARRAIEDYANRLSLLDAMTRQREIAEGDIMALDYQVKSGIKDNYRKKAAGKIRK